MMRLEDRVHMARIAGAFVRFLQNMGGFRRKKTKKKSSKVIIQKVDNQESDKRKPLIVRTHHGYVWR